MCTSFRLRARDGSVVVGRAMESPGFDVGSRFAAYPVGASFSGTAPDGTTALTWRATHGAVGLDALGHPLATDGVNDAGLYIGVLYLPGFSVYESPADHPDLPALSVEEVATWLLTTCGSVAEAKERLAQACVWGRSIPELGGMQLPLHLCLHDRNECVVVEWVGGERHVHDDPLGILTNSPPFDWHQINLRNYLNLRATSVRSVKIDGQTLAALGQGNGLLGLPGDWTPPSRFVRAAVVSALADPGASASEAVRTATHMLNAFDIPRGVVREQSGDAGASDYTEWATITDLTNLTYYVRPVSAVAFRKVSLGDVDLSGGDLRVAPIPGDDPGVVPFVF